MEPMDYKLDIRPVAAPENMVVGPHYRFTVLTDRLIRMEYQPQGLFVDEPTQRAICRDFPKTEFRIIDRADSLQIITAKLRLTYDKGVFSREGLRVELHESFHVYGSAWSYGDAVRDLGGTARTLDGADGAIALEGGLLSRQGFTILDDSRTAFLGPDQWPQPKDRESVDLYFFGYGHDYLGCLRDFYRLSGPVPLLPRFALGNWWSRFYRYTAQSYLELMDTFRHKGIPLSTAVLDMDWHLTEIPAKYGSGWTGYTWNRELFPDPEGFLDRLHELGLKVTLNVHPADGVRGHEEAYLPMARALGVDWEKEDKIPFDAADRSFLEAYFRYLHHPLEEQGVDFWWLDWQQGHRGSARGIDTLWLLNHLHFLDSGRAGRQPLTFSRYAGLGSHRYPVGFSGDTYATWASLDFQPYFTATASNAGYTWWSHDIGGHQGGRRDDELAVRWLQLGVFSPILRLHSTSNEFYGKEPWSYSPEAEAVMARFLRLRHRLIPYLHSMNHRTHLEGLPLVRPMYYHHDTPEAYQVPNQYYFGTELMVCPITRPLDRDTMLASFEVWLPEGEWYDFFTGQRYLGGRSMTMYRPLEQLPVLVKAGGILPLADDPGTSHLKAPGLLEVQVFPGDGAFELYEDGAGEPVITRFRFQKGLLTLQAPRDRLPEDRRYRFVFRETGRPAAVTVNGAETAWQYDEAERCLRVEVPASDAVELRLTGAEAVGCPRKQRIFELLRHMRISYDEKAQLYHAVCGTNDPGRLLGILYQMKPLPGVFGALLELILAESDG